MCNCQSCGNVHRVTTVTDNTTTLNLTVTNSTDIGNLEPFVLIMNKNVSVSTAPIPVTVTVNGTAVPLKNKYNLDIKSNKIPRRAVGAYVSVTTTTEDAETQATDTDSYVILFTTPYHRCNA